MDEIERLFLDTLSDLRVKIAPPSNYELLGAAALIRKLFLDESPLVVQVNRKYRLKITFEVNQPRGFPGFPEPVIYAALDAFDPDTAPPPVNPLIVNRAQLFSRVVERAVGHSYTVRDLVLFEAHVSGAVHAGQPKNDQQRALKDVSNAFLIGGRRPSLRQLQAVGRVILKGLEPLRQAVENAGRIPLKPPAG